jgi:hypothetical protein
MYTSTSLTLPAYADAAFGDVYDEWAGDEQYEAFASRWGGLELDAFQRALREGQEEDRLLAIFALGATATPEVAEMLVAILTHPLSLVEKNGPVPFA